MRGGTGETGAAVGYDGIRTREHGDCDEWDHRSTAVGEIGTVHAVEYNSTLEGSTTAQQYSQLLAVCDRRCWCWCQQFVLCDADSAGRAYDRQTWIRWVVLWDCGTVSAVPPTILVAVGVCLVRTEGRTAARDRRRRRCLYQGRWSTVVCAAAVLFPLCCLLVCWLLVVV